MAVTRDFSRHSVPFLPPISGLFPRLEVVSQIQLRFRGALLAPQQGRTVIFSHQTRSLGSKYTQMRCGRSSAATHLGVFRTCALVLNVGLLYVTV